MVFLLGMHRGVILGADRGSSAANVDQHDQPGARLGTRNEDKRRPAGGTTNDKRQTSKGDFDQHLAGRQNHHGVQGLDMHN